MRFVVANFSKERKKFGGPQSSRKKDLGFLFLRDDQQCSGGGAGPKAVAAVTEFWIIFAAWEEQDF